MIDRNHDSEEQAQMQKLTRIITLSVALTVVSGCSYVGVYKRDIPQGNLVTEQMVSKLQPGMTQDQVVYVMGRPLMEAPFDSNQWDYVYRLDEAYGDVEQRRVTLTFDPSGRLSNVQQQGNFSRDIPVSSDSGLGPALEGADPMDALPAERVQTQAPETAPAPQPVIRAE
ncbi:Beta-barrel assembly machine subunit BamE [Vreelandella songnenensis]|uniref:Outer membrane protein assembly factor BamE n=2 Tax=Vreelandella songnenensis TaxID=1176243 RepID=A0A2T0V2V9_9GAMM|nr:Beta-barrel assembly machine subunit BamE [Halomonas songnenensis]